MFNHYDPQMLFIAFRIDHEDKRQPTDQMLLDFEEAVFKRLDAELTKQADAAGIPPDLFSRSILMVFSKLSTATTPKTQVKHACEYFLSVQP
jgi:hypothetical protein